MKKLLIAGIACVGLYGHAQGLSLEVECVFTCPGVRTFTTTSSCKSVCNNCSGSTTSTSTNGVVQTQTKTLTTQCPKVEGGTADCSCDNVTSYKCASGYYGTATSATSGCTKCPANATCAGGNGSTFSCAKGYYKDGTVCARCPSSGGIYGTTASTGATSITSCYLPSGTTFSDSTGSGTYTSDCYYVN